MIKEKKTIQQISLYYDVYIPDSDNKKPLLIALHGYGGNKKSMMIIAQGINKQDYVIASLQGPYQHFLPSELTPNPLRPGFGWITKFKSDESIELHHNSIKSIIETLKNENRIDADNVFLLGFSQSVSLNYRFAFAYPELIKGVIATNGGTPGDLSNADKYRKINLSVLHISGNQDTIYTPKIVDQQITTLKLLVNDLEIFSFDGGHEFPPKTFPIIDKWIKGKIIKT